MNLSHALQFVSRSDTGMVRSHNEDAIYVSPAHGLAILADGMGGYNAGEVAAGMATTCLGSELENSLGKTTSQADAGARRRIAHEVLESDIARTNSAIYEAGQQQPQYAGMGTTLLVTLFYDNSLTVAHIGDSRLYRLRDGDFRVLTRDHSLLQEQLDAGMISPDEARHSHHKNLVTRALGIEPTVEAEIRDYDVQPGDVYLLCSDGLNDMVPDEQIGAILQATPDDPDTAANVLVETANDYGGRDNVSVVVVRVLADFAAPRGWFARMLDHLK